MSTSQSLLLCTGATAESEFQSTLTLGPDFTNIQNYLQWLRDRKRPNDSPLIIDYEALLVDVLNLTMETIFGTGYPAFPTSPIIISSPPLLVSIESWQDMIDLLLDSLDALYPEETLWSETDEYPGDGGGGDS